MIGNLALTRFIDAMLSGRPPKPAEEDIPVSAPITSMESPEVGLSAQGEQGWFTRTKTSYLAARDQLGAQDVIEGLGII